MTTVFIALGTNLGQMQENLRIARKLLPPEARVQRLSMIRETAPWGYTQQPPFLNQVLEADTDLPPHRLLDHLKAIEARMGREASVRYGPRLIDLDILYYGHTILESPGLMIPHPRLHERSFVLEPLAEIAPDWIHPLLRKMTLELLTELKQG